MNEHRFVGRAVTFFALLILLASGLALAADNALVLGKWTIAIDFQGQATEATLELVEKDGALAGTWTSQRGTNDLSDIAWDGTTLTFKRNIDFQGQALSLDYTATVKGDSLEGRMTTPRGEQPFTGKRAAE
jgi:hypothetical protein